MCARTYRHSHAHVGPQLPIPSHPLRVTFSCSHCAVSVCVRVFVACCQNSSAGDGERTGHCRLRFQHRESCLSSETLIKGRRSAKAANRCYHCSRVLIDFNYTHIRFLVLLSRCRRLCRTVDNVYPLDLFYWFFVWFYFFLGIDWNGERG